MSGFTVNSFERVTISFLGSEIPALRTVASVEGIPYYVIQFQKYNLALLEHGVIIRDIENTDGQAAKELESYFEV